jgi:penicillin-binding protein 1A
VLGICCGVLAGAFFGLTQDLPQIRQLKSFKPSSITRLYDTDGVVLAELFLEKRNPVSLSKIPYFLKAGLLATEDRNFYKHSGVDLKGIFRAIIRDIQAGEFVEGASTITQQLAKTLFLTSKKTLMRKLQEAILAFQIERRYTKDEILELYLNQIYLGSGAYGVESAANIFFDKPVQSLNLAECALIAAMPKAPSRYSPLINEELALQRRNIVLKQMLETGIIQTTDYDRAVQKPIAARHPSRFEKAPYFIDYVKKKLEKELGPTILYKGGLNIYTTLSSQIQHVAEDAVQKGLETLETRMRKTGVEPAAPQGALIALGVNSGSILAMVGGRDYFMSAYNRATSARRQPGSAFKPIVYAYAVEKGFPQNRMILDAPIIFKKAAAGQDWAPENFSKTYMGEITFRKALALSKNIPAVRLLQTLGPASVIPFAHKLGIESPLSPNLSLVLGTSEVTLLELTSTYTVFANKGKAVKPFGVMEIVDDQGHTLWRHKPQKQFAMTEGGAAVVTDMLKGVIQEGTGRRARVLGRPLAGKTGTTDSYKDALFVGFSPEIAAGVWVGQDRSETLGDRETGAKAALPIWISFMAEVLKDRPYAFFDIPDDVIQARMDPDTGRLLNEDASESVTVLIKKSPSS